MTRPSIVENLMIDILKKSRQPLTLKEITTKIKERNSTLLCGSTPDKSLYSIVFRRENRRISTNNLPYFAKYKRGGAIYYSLNNKELEN